MTTLIIPAAGSGKRFGGSLPKQFVQINNQSIILQTIKAFEQIIGISQIIISLQNDWIDYCKSLVEMYKIKKEIIYVTGGEQRQDSVYNALKEPVIKDSKIILVHDAVRPYPSEELIYRIIENTKKFGAAIPGVLLKDTVKSIDEKGFAQITYNRDNLRSIQTPQGFTKEILIESYKKAFNDNYYSTDDAALAEYAGYKVKIVEGEATNIKITSAEDLN